MKNVNISQINESDASKKLTQKKSLDDILQKAEKWWDSLSYSENIRLCEKYNWKNIIINDEKLVDIYQKEFLSNIPSILKTANIYVETVRSFLEITTDSAIFICENGVKENLLTKHIGLICPNDDRIIQSYKFDDIIPNEICCQICESLEQENSTFKTSDLKKISFYRLKN